MDNQAPQQFKLHNHSPEQQAILGQLLQQIVGDLCNFVFSDPAKDQQMIRAHAALMGKKELLQQLLHDDYPPAPEQDMQQPHQAGDDASDFKPNF